MSLSCTATYRLKLLGLLVLLFPAVAFGQEVESKKKDGSAEKSGEPVFDEAKSSEYLQTFERQLNRAERIDFYKVGSLGTAAVVLDKARYEGALSKLAKRISATKFTKVLTPKPGFTKPSRKPLWRIELKELAPETKPDGAKFPSAIVLEDKYIRFFIDDQELICETMSDIDFSNDEELWELFGKLLLSALR